MHVIGIHCVCLRPSHNWQQTTLHSSNLRMNHKNSVTISSSCTPDSQANQQGISGKQLSNMKTFPHGSELSWEGIPLNCCFNKYPRMGKIISREFQVLRQGRNNDHNCLHVVNQEEVDPGQHVTTHFTPVITFWFSPHSILFFYVSEVVLVTTFSPKNFQNCAAFFLTTLRYTLINYRLELFV